MNGIHDMGGMDGFGPIEPETDEPVFHEAWEGRVLALTRETVLTNQAAFYDERFTTDLAEQSPADAPEDARAAAHLLSSYLTWASSAPA